MHHNKWVIEGRKLLVLQHEMYTWVGNYNFDIMLMLKCA